MPCFYLEPDEQDASELKLCIAEALYDIESILADPGAHPTHELRRLREQIVSNLERAWTIAGGSEAQLTGVIAQISGVVAGEFR